MSEVDQVLSAAETASRRDSEIARVLQCHSLDYFSLLEVDAFSSELVAAVRKQFRKKSLLIHPDKSDHPEAARAFDLLKKAQAVLNAGDEDSALATDKQRLVDIYKHARELVDKKKNASLEKEVRRILDEESAHQRLEDAYKRRADAQEREAQQKQTQEREEKKKTAAQWEDDRDSRVSNWRQYLSENKKKRAKEQTGKKKRKVLA